MNYLDVMIAEMRCGSFFYVRAAVWNRRVTCNRSGALILQYDGFNSVELVVSAVIIIVCLCAKLCGACDDQQEEESQRAKLADKRGLPPYLRKELETTATLQDQWSLYLREPLMHQRKPIPGVSSSLEASGSYSRDEQQSVKAMRGGEFIGNRMRFKVKVVNESGYTITDVRVFLISYPTESLRLVSDDDDAYFSKIEPSGFRSPSFDFLPTHDCVQGDISAGVSYVDMKGQPHSLTTKPFVIRSVCDLLIPDQIDPKEFALKLKELECGEMVVRVTDWTPEEMYEKALHIVEDANFFEVTNSTRIKDGVIHGKISGLARGKFTGKSIAVELYVTGPSGKKGASCKIKVSGEDQAMILPAIDDLRERLNAWLCPMCSSPLTLENVEQLKDGKAVVCPFCRVSIGR